jgi:hypothetical protein
MKVLSIRCPHERPVAPIRGFLIPSSPPESDGVQSCLRDLLGSLGPNLALEHAIGAREHMSCVAEYLDAR